MLYKFGLIRWSRCKATKFAELFLEFMDWRLDVFPRNREILIQFILSSLQMADCFLWTAWIFMSEIPSMKHFWNSIFAIALGPFNVVLLLSSTGVIGRFSNILFVYGIRKSHGKQCEYEGLGFGTSVHRCCFRPKTYKGTTRRGLAFPLIELSLGCRKLLDIIVIVVLGIHEVLCS